ncbi:MAG TPA: type I-U CRISPR-associated RAMP protein Csb1/Cas7u [Pirellulales bacterium]|nr:type I-U CRISPR-associated RAMP protein Csb1/Cas7u [Pirellulales bacterium]
MSDVTQFDHYLKDEGPAALVIREPLMPVEGADGVLFPATFAAGDGFPGGYNIDGDPNGTNICLVDSVGSQANRIEPLFAQEKYRALVPQIVVRAGEKEVNLLDAGHRAGDAIVRCSELQGTLRDAFKAVLNGDAQPLAKIAPTSLVFGVWDSRDTQAKLPRLVASTIRAFNVRKLTRSAQYIPAAEYVATNLLDEPADKTTKDAYAERGFIHVPAAGSHGGVIATGGVRRDATLGLAALRLLSAGKDENKTLAMRRYVLGLALTAFTHNPSAYLRQGCLLVLDPSKAKDRTFVEVYPNGDRQPANMTHETAIKYATATAQAFGVGDNKTVEFDKDRARKDVKGDAAEGEKVKGEIVSVDAGGKKFTLKHRRSRFEVSTTEGTVYFKGENESTFEILVVAKCKVEVELANGFATKVIGK